MFRPKLIDALRHYDRPTFMADLFAGVTVGVVALPLAMAFAIASGLPPERGLFTAIVAGFLISALGGSRVQIGGPTGAFVIIVAGIYAEHGYEGLVWCTILASGLLIALGIAKMGVLIKFIPFPVTTGFTAGIAVVIFSTQIRDLFGLTMPPPPAGFIEKWMAYYVSFDTINWQATGVSLCTIIVILIFRRFIPKFPAMLAGMLIATVVVALFGLDVETIGQRFGELPRSLPMPGLPGIDPAKLRELVVPAFTIAMLAAIESLLSATVADGMTGGRHRPNTELIATGVANIGSVAFGGIPATGAIARTATNVKSGAKTPVSGMVHSITLVLLLLFVAPYAGMIPLAALAGILVVVAYNMSEIDHVIGLLKAPRSDVMVLLSTFTLTVLVDLTVAVQVGVVLAALLFIRRMSEVTNIGMITREFEEGREKFDPLSIKLREVPEDVVVFEIEGPFFFGAADRFKETMLSLAKPPRAIILRMRAVNAIDATGLHVIEEFHERCKRTGTHLILSGVHAQPLVAMSKSGLADKIGEDNVPGNIDDSLDRVRELLGLEPAPRPSLEMIEKFKAESAQP
jgi:SulP family sulfate permease